MSTYVDISRLQVEEELEEDDDIVAKDKELEKLISVYTDRWTVAMIGKRFV